MPSNETHSSAKQATTKKNRTNDECLAYLLTKWRDILTKRFSYFFDKSPQSGQRMERIIDCMIQCLEYRFLHFSNQKDTHFNTEIMQPGISIYSQRIAEMLFYCRLMEMHFGSIRSGDAGPDFIAEKDGETFCFEVVTPTPQDSIRELIGRDNLESEERNLVFRERLLSVTSAIRKKLKKFEDHKLAGYVPEGAHYIIVINDSLLLPYDKPWYGAFAELCFGDSTLPIAVDATLGSGEIDLTNINIQGEALSKNNSDQFQELVVRSNFGVSINGGETITAEDALSRVKTRKEIPSRKNTGTVLVDIAETMGVAGIYQITLREDLMFFRCFESTRNINPPSSLISSQKNKQLVRNSIPSLSTYAKGEVLVQPMMSPARLFGFEPHDFNSMSIYNSFFRPFLEGDEQS